MINQKIEEKIKDITVAIEVVKEVKNLNEHYRQELIDRLTKMLNYWRTLND